MSQPEAPPSRFRSGEIILPGLLAWERLGDGRRCESWLAWSVPLWSHVVVKLPIADLVADRRTARRLGDEADLLRRLAHPAIQRLLHDGHRDAVPHLVLEYVEGPTLELLVEDEGLLAAGDVARLGMQLASALHYLHGQGLVHLDVKPGNVVLREGRSVLIDLDIARPIGAPTGSGRPHGTRDYMAPEQCAGERAHPGMDLFALGAVLYELATGERAFDGEASSAEYAQLTGPPPPPSLRCAAVPPALERAIESLLAPDPTRRPPTALAAMRLLAASVPLGEESAWPDFVGLLLARVPVSADEVLDGHLAQV